MDDKKYMRLLQESPNAIPEIVSAEEESNPKFTPTVAIKITSPFINKTERRSNTVKFDCTGVTHKSDD